MIAPWPLERARWRQFATRLSMPSYCYYLEHELVFQVPNPLLKIMLDQWPEWPCVKDDLVLRCPFSRAGDNNNNNDFISIALFHAKHAQLR